MSVTGVKSGGLRYCIRAYSPGELANLLRGKAHMHTRGETSLVGLFGHNASLGGALWHERFKRL